MEFCTATGYVLENWIYRLRSVLSKGASPSAGSIKTILLGLGDYVTLAFDVDPIDACQPTISWLGG